jgi:hypothetical protein
MHLYSYFPKFLLFFCYCVCPMLCYCKAIRIGEVLLHITQGCYEKLSIWILTYSRQVLLGLAIIFLFQVQPRPILYLLTRSLASRLTLSRKFSLAKFHENFPKFHFFSYFAKLSLVLSILGCFGRNFVLTFFQNILTMLSRILTFREIRTRNIAENVLSRL